MRASRLVDGAMGPFLEGPADGLIERAWEARPHNKRCGLARRALAADLDCIDAYNILAQEAETHAESMALLREAVRIGERHFAPLLDDPEMHWWGFVGTRPFMRAMHHLGLELAAAGDLGEAEATYRRLLEMNPDDNQGVRYLLMALLCRGRRVGDCRALLERYPDDYSVEFAMTALWADLVEDRRAEALARVPGIREMNPHVLPLLLEVIRGSHTPSESYTFIEAGARSEADVYALRFRDAWRGDKKLRAAIAEICAGDT